MKIEIEQNCSGTGDYRWYLYTGPERIDEYTGYCYSLGECFEKIVIWNRHNAQKYTQETKMTFNNDIEKTEGEIKVLQAKLELLKEMEIYKSPVEESYKDVYGVYPPTTPSVDNTDDIRWRAFRAGYVASKNDCEEPTKPMDEVVERLVKKYQAQKLWSIIRDKLGFSIDMCDEIVDAVEEWLPKEQSAEGSQSVDTELLVDGFNHCLQKMKGMLR